MNSLNQLLWDKTWPLIKLTGEGAREFLNGQTTADLRSVQEGKIFCSCWLTTTGKLRALLEIRINSNGAEVIVLAGESEAVARGLDQMIFPADKLRIEPIEVIRRIQIIGGKDSGDSNKIAWIPIDNSLPKEFQNFPKATFEQLECWRFKKGFPISLGEIKVATNPFELGLSTLVSQNKGCYLGQEVLARVVRSGVLKQKLRFCQADFDISVGETIKAINNTGGNIKDVGVITSSIYHQDLETSTGLVMIKSQFSSRNDLFVSDQSRILRIEKPLSFNGMT